MRRSRISDARYVEVCLTHASLERQGRVVLDDVSWTLRPGQRWVLAGGNGAGKTQLLKLVAGAVWPAPAAHASRRYRWRGETFDSPFEVKDEIGYLGPEGQDKYERYQWNHTVERIVGTGLYRTDIPLSPLSTLDRRRIAGVLAKLAIEGLAARPFLSLSYGERRLTLLARALASRPKLLLLDELLSGLDEVNRQRAMRWLVHTSRSRLPWVLASHRVADIPRTATHALVLEDGRIVYRGAMKAAPLRRWLTDSLPRSAAASRHRRGSSNRVLVRLTRANVYLSEQRVLKNLSFEVRSGECWVVHGRNGSGKTTLVRALYGDHSIAGGGRIKRVGVAPGVPLENFRRLVGLVAPHLQSAHPRELTVREVVQSGLHASIGLNDEPTAADRAAARRSLAFLGLANLASRPLRELSYGQLRRVLFARAWVGRPTLLLLDEPFSGVDGPTRRMLRDQLHVMATQGTTIFMTTHHREEWPAGTTHELELADGRLVYAGPVRSRGARARGA